MSPSRQGAATLLRRLDGHPLLLRAAAGLRARLPGDQSYGDSLSVAGDERAVELLRRVGLATEPVIARYEGRVVKRLGDGLMAIFDDPCAAVDAALEAAEAVEGITVDGHRPRQRAGVHLGRPRRLGSDYFGVDVNVAARVAAAAGPGQVLVSHAARDRLDDAELQLRRRWRFKAKGAPKDLDVYAATRS